MRTSARVLFGIAAASLTAIASGCGGDKATPVAGGGPRTIDVTMADNSYHPPDPPVSLSTRTGMVGPGNGNAAT